MPIEAATDRNRILVRGTRFEQKDLCKSIAGVTPRYDKSVTPNKFLGWSYPLTMGTCHELRRVFGRELIILPSLADWYRKEAKRVEDLEATRTDGVADLSRVRDLAPELYMAMQARPYQPIGSAFIVTGGQVILGDEPGLGKTLQTLAAAIQSGAREILVCCPVSTTSAVWADETNRWTPCIAPFVAQGSHAERQQVMDAYAAFPHYPKMLIVNPAMVRAKKASPKIDRPKSFDWPFLHNRKWDMIVMDESHEILAGTAHEMSSRITQGRYGAMKLRRNMKPGGLAVSLSGTPFRSDLLKAWGQLNWVRPDVFTGFWRFAEEHFKVVEGEYGKEVSGEPLDPDRFNAAIRPYFLGRTKIDVAPDLPPVMYAGTRPKDNQTDGLQAIWLDLLPEQRKIYKQIEADAEIKLESGTMYVNGILAEITRKRQLASACGIITSDGYRLHTPSNKLDWVREFLREREGVPGKVVIASEFTQMVHLAEEMLAADGHKCLTLTGETNSKQRAALVRMFADPKDEHRVCILNMHAGGVGITLDQADDMILLDVPWKSDVEKQVIDRIHRVSRVHNVTVYRVLSKGTIDEWMGSLTDKQRRILQGSSPEAIELAREGMIR